MFGGAAMGLLVAELVAPLPGLIVAMGSIAFGFLWEGNGGRGAAAFKFEPSPPISRPVAFLGMAFIGVFPGGLLAEFLDSIWVAVVVVVFAASAYIAWAARVEGHPERVGTIVFLASAFLTGLVGVYLVASWLGHNAF